MKRLTSAATPIPTSTPTSMATPLSFDRHVYFVDFETFGFEAPVWFSVVRDPVRKFVSRFRYARVGGKSGLFEKLVRNNASSVFGLTKAEWLNKDINK